MSAEFTIREEKCCTYLRCKNCNTTETFVGPSKRQGMANFQREHNALHQKRREPILLGPAPEPDTSQANMIVGSMDTEFN